MGDRRRRTLWALCGAAALAVTLGYAATVRTAEVTPDGKLTMTPDEVASCEREGGCLIVTRAALMRFIQSCQSKGSI